MVFQRPYVLYNVLYVFVFPVARTVYRIHEYLHMQNTINRTLAKSHAPGLRAVTPEERRRETSRLIFCRSANFTWVYFRTVLCMVCPAALSTPRGTTMGVCFHVFSTVRAKLLVRSVQGQFLATEWIRDYYYVDVTRKRLRDERMRRCKGTVVPECTHTGDASPCRSMIMRSTLMYFIGAMWKTGGPCFCGTKRSGCMEP